MSTNIFLQILQGALIGLGAVLPGISGGVLSVVFGVYKPMMEFLADPKARIRTHFPMLFPYFLGYALGFLGIARILGFFLTRYPNECLCLFAGIILGTVPSLYREAKEGTAPVHRLSPILFLMIAGFLMFLLLLTLRLSSFQIQPNFFWYLFCGFCLALSVIAPGMSFSTLLMPLGLYTPFVNGLGHFSLPVLIPGGIGGLLTILFLSRFINYLYDRYPVYTKHAILGIVFTATVMIIPFDKLYDSFYHSPRNFILLCVYLGIGFMLSLLSEGKT